MIKFSSLRKLRNKTIVGISLIVFVIAGCVDSKVQSVYYDKIVNGKSDEVPTKWMYINMKIDLI